MTGKATASWTTQWLESLDGERLRALARAFFERTGYQVATIECPDLDFELSQPAPMAPRVGLCCRSESEGIDMPALKQADAAVSLHDHGFGIVVKNGAFRPEEKMYAQGKPLQLIDSEDFVKKLSHLPPADQEALAAEFDPSPPAPAAGITGSRGSTGTPDFITKLENLPGFGNKKRAATAASASSPPPSGPAAPPPSAASSTPAPAPVAGLDLSKAPSAPSPRASLPPAAGGLPPLAGILSAPGGGPMKAALPPLRVPPVQQAAPQGAAPSMNPLPKNAASPPSPANPARRGDAVEHARGDEKIPASSAQSTHPSGQARSGADADGKSPRPAAAAQEPKPGRARRKSAESPKSAAEILPAPPPVSAPAAAIAPSGIPGLSPTPPPLSQPALPSPATSAATATAGPPRTRRRSRRLLTAVVVLPLLLVPILGGFILVKKVLTGKKPVPVVVQSPPEVAPPAPRYNPEELKALSQSLATGIARLQRVTAEVESKEMAVRIASLATAAHKAGADFVSIGGGTVLGSIAALEKGTTISEASQPGKEKSFGPLDLEGVSREDAARYLIVEDDLLKVSMDPGTPASGEKATEPLEDPEALLGRLEEILNEQHIAAARKNAKRLVEAAAIALSGGLDFTAGGRRDLDKTIAAIAEGETVANHLGSGNEVFFGLPDMPEKAQRAAVAYLAIEEGKLKYIENPDPAPKPAFDLGGNDLLYDLERAASLALKAAEHVEGSLATIAADAAKVAVEQESILALTGEPDLVTFASGALTLLLPRDFSYKHEDSDCILISPKYAASKEAIWLRLRLQSPESQPAATAQAGADRLESLAKSLGRPVEKLGDKSFYWKNEEVLEGDLLYWVTERHVGFANSIVVVADATARGMEELPEVGRLQQVLPDIIRSLRETGKAPLPAEAAEAGNPPLEPPKQPLLPGSQFRR